MSITVLHQSKPKARKEHQCSSCYRVIRVGEVYERQDNVYDGNRYTYLMCEHCRHLVYRVMAIVPDDWYDDGFSDDTIREGMRERAETVADLRLYAWFLRRWTRGDGSTVPLADVEIGRQ